MSPGQIDAVVIFAFILVSLAGGILIGLAIANALDQ